MIAKQQIAFASRLIATDVVSYWIGKRRRASCLLALVDVRKQSVAQLNLCCVFHNRFSQTTDGRRAAAGFESRLPTRTKRGQSFRRSPSGARPRRTRTRAPAPPPAFRRDQRGQATSLPPWDWGLRVANVLRIDHDPVSERIIVNHKIHKTPIARRRRIQPLRAVHQVKPIDAGRPGARRRCVPPHPE